MSQSLDGAPEAGIQAVGGTDNGDQQLPHGRPDPDEIFPKIVGWYRTARDHWQEQRQEMAEAFDLRAGHQWSDEDLQILSDQMRPAITFNRIGPFLDAVSGMEINNRQETVYVARQLGSGGKAELMTSAAQWMRQECDAEDEETEMFMDAVSVGWGWCLSGDAMVRLPTVHMMTTRLYTGPIVKISMENGQSLTGTANHPVLTTSGWKRLCALNEGDNLVDGAFLKEIVGFPLDQFNDVETRLEDEVDSFRTGRETIRVATARNDFNGDGIGSKIHIVYADRALKRKILKAARLQKIKKDFLAWREFLARYGLSLLGGGLLENAGFVAEHQSTFSAAQAPNLHFESDLPLSQLISATAELFSDCFSDQTMQSADFSGRHFLLEVEAPQFVERDFGARAASVLAQGVPASSKPHLHSSVGYPNLLPDFHDWKPLLEVEARKLFGGDGIRPELVTRVRSRTVDWVTGFAVHDVATDLGLFIAGSIITSNTQSRMDYDNDPDGIGVVERVDPLEMFPDPNARKQNLSDRRYHLRVKDVPVGAAEDLFPGYDAVLLHAQWAEDQPDATRQPHNARLAPYYRIDQSADIDRNEQLIRLVEVEWWDYETAYRVLDPDSGRWVLLDEKRAAFYMMAARLARQHPHTIKDKRRKYWKAIVGAEVLKIMDGPKQGGFSYKCITGKRDANRGTWYGIIRAMKDPQLWANKWLSQGLHIFNTNAKGGLLAETDAFADIDEARDDWASADSITELNPGGLAKVKAKEPPQFPAQLNQMMAFAIEAIPQVSGINVEMLGQSTSQQPQVALLEAGRRQQGMNVLAGLFNAKRRYHKEQGRLWLWMIQEYIADGRLIRVGGAEEAQYVPLIHEPGLAEYDVIVDDAPTSTNMKERVWGALMQLFPMLRGAAIPPKFYVAALKYAPVPESAVTEFQEILSEPPPPNPKLQAEEALNAARTTTERIRGVHVGAQAQKTLAEASLLPEQHELDVLEQQSKIEKTRADAANALQNAGIVQDDMRFKQTMAAVDALLGVHGAALNHAQAVHTMSQPPDVPTTPATAPAG